MQIYEGEYGKIVHGDFYRIESITDIAELGWQEACEDAILLIEWAEKAPELFNGDRLDVRLSFAEPERREARMVTVSGYGASASRLAAFKSLHEFSKSRALVGCAQIFFAR